jgi:hypothetical protein
MLAKDQERLYSLSDSDRSFYRMLLPREHPLLDALQLIGWQAFVPELESYYCSDMGQPAIPPLLMLKLEFLRYFCRLSDREGDRSLTNGCPLSLVPAAPRALQVAGREPTDEVPRPFGGRGI